MARKDARKASALAHTVSDVSAAISTTYNDYVNSLTPRLKLVDLFLGFLVLLGALQFVYVVLVGNFPFNAFLGGFISCVGQFVLTVSLRLQYNAVSTKPKLQHAEKEADEADLLVETEAAVEPEFAMISPERALGDYVFASLILHFIVYHFIN